MGQTIVQRGGAGLPTTPANIYAAANGSDSNSGLSTSAPKLTLAAALSLIPNPSTTSCTIHIASGTHSWALVNTARAYLSKKFIGNSDVYLKIRGYINSTPNSFTDSAADSGTSSGSNQSLFPINTTPAEDYTYFNDTSKSWTVNGFTGCILRITGGTGYVTGAFDNYLNWYVISSNTATRLTLVGRYTTTTPDATTTYEIYDPANAAILSGTGATIGIRTYNAENIIIEFLNIEAPDTGSTQNMSSNKSKNINYFMCRIAGGSGILEISELNCYKCYFPVTTTKDTGLICIYYNQIIFSGSYMIGWKRRGITISSGTLEVINSWIRTDTTTATTDGTTHAGVWADVGGQIITEFSRIEGLNTTAVENYAFVTETESIGFIKQYTHLKGRVASSNTYGMLISLNSKVGSTKDYFLVEGNYIGVKVATGGAWATGPGPIYSGNTINEVIEPSANKTTAGFVSNLPRPIDPTKYLYVSDDFISGNITSGQIGSLNWSLGVSGTGVLSVVSGESNHHGNFRLDTGTTSGSNSLIYLYQSGTKGLLPADMFDVLFIIRLNTNDSDTLVRAGLQSAAGANPPNNGIYFEKLAADSSWYGVTRASSSENRTAAIASTNTNWVRLRIRRVDSATIEFSVDGGTEVTATATIPTVDLNPALHIKNSTGTGKTVDIDYFDLLISGISR